MRVVAGTHKGQRIAAPKLESVRPTQDKVREAIFSMLGSVDGISTLDLFAGSGALGIEAKSRGAGNTTFVDADRAALHTVEDNLARLQITGTRLFRTDALAFLRGAARHKSRWGLVFLDPPYRLADRLAGELESLLPAVIEPDAKIVCESSHEHPLRLAMPVLVERRYGDTLIVIHQNGDPDAT